MYKKGTKIIASLLVFMLMMTNVSVLGEAFATNLENQKIQTNNKNVEFDAYFKNENNKEHTTTKTVGEDNYLYTAIQVKEEGYLKDIVLTVENANFSIKKVESEKIEKIEDNKIYLKRIESGNTVEVELPIEILQAETLQVQAWNENSKVTLKATYINGNAKEEQIEKEISLKLNWTVQKEAELSIEVAKFVPYEVSEQKGVLLQTIVKSALKDNILPVKESKIEVTVPVINGNYPIEVKVSAKTTKATNGDETANNFTEDNYNYNEQRRKVEITVKNEANDKGEISWSKQAQDEFLITYIYPEEVNNIIDSRQVKVELKANSELTVYEANETKVSKSIEQEVELKEKINDIIDFELQTNIEELGKGQIYANYQASEKLETEFKETLSANVSYANVIDEITISQNTERLSAPNKSQKTELNEVCYKTVSISKETFDKMFGEEGNIVIFTENTDKVLSVIDNETEVDEQGNLTVNVQNTNNLKIRTSRPLTEGNISFEITKAIKGKTNISIKTMQEADQLYLSAHVLASNSEVNFVNVSSSKNIKLVEPSIQTELNIDNNNLSTVVPNKNVKITAVLKTDTLNCSLYNNPTLRITLPEYITQIDIKNIEVLFTQEGSNLVVKSHKVEEGSNGTKVIVIELQGNQTEYTLGAVSKGINVVITADITINKFAPNKQEKITMKCANEGIKGTGIFAGESESSADINFVAPAGVITTNSVANYAENAQEVISISGEEKTAILETVAEEREATFSMNVINNCNNTIDTISILGRTIFKGNTDIISGKDLGSTIDIPLTSKISVSSSEATVYYSTNANATKDVALQSNGWTTDPEDLSNVKSYLIVLNNTTMNTADTISFSYTAKIPANLQHNEAGYENYVVYFNNNLATGKVEDKAIATKVGVATPTGPVLEANITSNVEEEVTVPTGKFIKYTVSVKNAGKSVAENVKASIDLPDALSYIEFTEQEGTGYYNEYSDRTNLTYDFENIEVNETSTRSFWVIVNNSNESSINVSATITAKDLEKSITTETTNKIEKAYFNIEQYVISTTSEGVILSEGDSVTYNYKVNLYDSGITAKNTIVTMVIPDGLEYKNAYVSTTKIELDQNYKADFKTEHITEGINYNEKTKTLTINLGETSNYPIGTIVVEAVIEKLPENVYEKQIKSTISVKADGIQEETSNKLLVQVGKEHVTISQTSTITNNSLITAGEDYSYIYEIKNTGGASTDLLTFKTVIPEALQYISTTMKIDDYTNSYYPIKEDNSIEIKLSLQKGQTAVITIQVIANELEEAQTITSKATVSSDAIGTITSNTITNTIEKVQYNDSEDNGQDQVTRRISGQVWIDSNNDGIKDIEEEIIPNVEVLLFDNATRKLVADEQGNTLTQITNSDGIYEFIDIPQGTYTVIFLYDTTNYSATTYHTNGVDETKNSDGIDTEITIGNQKRIAAITEQIAITDKNIYNIDLGLTINPKFDLKLDKTVSKITVQDSTGTTIYNYEDTKLAKRDLVGKRINGTTIIVEYKIKITNEGAIAGFVKKIADYMPTEMTFNSELNTDWYVAEDGTLYNTSLANSIISPNESKEVTLILTKKLSEDNLGIYTNTAEIYEAYNDLGIADVDSTPANKLSNEDDISSADVLVTVKTGEAYLFVGLSISIITIIGVGAYFIKKKVLR